MKTPQENIPAKVCNIGNDIAVASFERPLTKLNAGYFFINDVTRSLSNYFESQIKFIIGNNPDLLHISRVEFQKFLIMINRKAEKINHYINSDRNKNLSLNAFTENFIFTYIVLPSKESKFKIQYIRTCEKEFDSNYLISRIIKRKGYVYILKSQFGYKIGCSAKLQDRLKYFGVKLPFDFSLHSLIQTPDYGYIEGFLHNLLRDKRINGEWFNLSEVDFIEIDKILENLKLKREIK